MANNKTTKVSANKTTKVSANKTAVDAVVPSQSQAISELTDLVRQLMAEITELKAAKANSEIKSYLPDNKTPVVTNKKDHTVVTNKTTVVAPSANKTPVVPNKKDHIVMPKVNVVPANKFVPLAEGTVISELVTISSIGTPFSSKWGSRQAVNCVTGSGNTMVTFVNIVRDAIGNTIACGLVGGSSYVMTGTASGRTTEFNGITSNIINKARFAKA